MVTSLHARDHARVYLKQMVDGAPEQRLSPEEERAVALALGRPVPPAARARRPPPRRRPTRSGATGELDRPPDPPA